MAQLNGFPVVRDAGDPRLRAFVIPGVKGTRARVQNGWAGFLIVCAFTWFNRHVERLDGKLLDDWFHAYRAVRAGSGWSYHAPGLAGDANATRHPLGTDPRHNFTPQQITKIRRLVRGMPGLRWGGDYNGRKDPMHLEWTGSPAAATRLARTVWMRTRTGRDVLKANPGFARDKGVRVVGKLVVKDRRR